MRIAIVLVALGAAALSTYLGLETRRNRLVWDHFDVVKPDILYRSGQLNPDQLTEAVKRYGLRTVVNFQRPGPGVDQRARAGEGSLGVDFLNLPMTGDGAGQELQFREVLKACDDPDRRPVLVHCARGTCRTGASVALYRFERDGWTIADVAAEMRRQSYKDGWLPGYVYQMVKNRQGFPLPDPPVTLDRNLPDAETARVDPERAATDALHGRSRLMPADSTAPMRTSLRLRADLAGHSKDAWPSSGTTRPVVLAVLAVGVRAASGRRASNSGRSTPGWGWPLASGSGRSAGSSATGTPRSGRFRSPWASSGRYSRKWGRPKTSSAGRRDSPGVMIGIILARRSPLDPRESGGILVALAWFGCIGDDGSVGVDRARPDCRLWARSRRSIGSCRRGRGGWSASGPRLAFLAAGWPPLAVLGLATVVLGRPGAGWSWKTTIPVALTVARLVGLGTFSRCRRRPGPRRWALPITQSSAWGLAFSAIELGLPWSPFVILAASRTLARGGRSKARAMVRRLAQGGRGLPDRRVDRPRAGVGGARAGARGAGDGLGGLLLGSTGLEDQEDLPEAVDPSANRRLALAIAGIWLTPGAGLGRDTWALQWRIIERR